MRRNVLALIAALGMLTPGVCVCGCPCEMLLAGDPAPPESGAPPTPSCCHPHPPTSGVAASQPRDCCCDAQKPPTAEPTPTSAAPADAGVPLLAAAIALAGPLDLEVEARTGPDPPKGVNGPDTSSLHAVLRN